MFSKWVSLSGQKRKIQTKTQKNPKDWAFQIFRLELNCNIDEDTISSIYLDFVYQFIVHLLQRNKTHPQNTSSNRQTFVSITEYRKSNTPNLFVHAEYWSQTASFSSGKLLNARLLKTKNNNKQTTEKKHVFRWSIRTVSQRTIKDY